MKRRAFLQTVAIGAGVVGQNVYVPRLAAGKEIVDTVAGMPRRVLGRTGVKVSIVAYPGFALREDHADAEVYTASIRKALENGVNYFDVAPAYANTKCESRMGEAFAAIKDFRRDSIFLACKTNKRTKDESRQELENSLKLLKTDYFDLYQLHCLLDPKKDVEVAFAPNGAMETLLQAKEEGKVRHLGFSAHTTAAALAAMQQYPFDTVMFPINFVELFRFGFGKKVLELAEQQGAAVVAIKPMSGGDWPENLKGKNSANRPRQWWYRTLEDQQDINLAMRFTLSQPAVVAGVPPAWLDLAEKGQVAGKGYRPLSQDDIAKLRKMADEAFCVFQAGEQVARHEWPHEHEPQGPHERCPGAMC